MAKVDNKNEDIKSLMTDSGNSFHYRVVDFLREKGWTVEISPYYSDNFTDKPREIDVIAEKEYEVCGHFGQFQDVVGKISVQLFVECKYITKNTIFWFDKKDIAKAIDRVIKDTPLRDPEKWSMIKEHRYLKDVQVAKLYSSNLTKNSDQQADDPIYKALSQSLNAMIYYKDSPPIIKQSPRYRGISSSLKYPVILCNNFDKFYKYDAVLKSDPELINDNFSLEINYAYLDKERKHEREYFLIDIVDFSKIEKLIDEIENNDIVAIKKKIYYGN